MEFDMEKVIDSSFIYVSYKDATNLDFDPPTGYYIRDAMDNFVFIKSRSRKVAQQLVNTEYGAHKYTVSSSKLF